MDIVRISAPRVGRLFAAFGFIVASILPALVPSLVAAATVTERSIALSSSIKATTGVKYDVNFKAATSNTGAYIIDFCTDPTIGTTCNTPTGFSASGVGATSGSDTISAVDANTVKVVLGSSKNAGDAINDTLTNITNPSGTGAFYARIVTYEDGTTNYHYTSATNIGTTSEYLDTGGVAMSITDGFGVNGAVLESMVFCAAPSTATINTGCTGGPFAAPNLTLGTDGVLTTTPSEGTIKTQISSNAVGGVVVSLKSNAAGCGGLVRAGAASNAAGCGITPITTTGVTTISGAKFGLKLGNLGGANSTTTAASGNYNTTDYYLGYNSNDESTGVTSPYGDPIYQATGPVSDGTADLTFGAAVSNLTPAGNYSATLNLIATGKF